MKAINEYRIKILEKHLDTFGHVNNATYLQLYEEARWDLTISHGFGIAQIKKENIGPTILAINLSFKREILLRENILIKTYFAGMKNKFIMILHQEMINDKGVVASRIDLEIAIMDTIKRKMILPPEKWWGAIGVAQNEIFDTNFS